MHVDVADAAAAAAAAAAAHAVCSAGVCSTMLSDTCAVDADADLAAGAVAGLLQILELTLAAPLPLLMSACTPLPTPMPTSVLAFPHVTSRSRFV